MAVVDLFSGFNKLMDGLQVEQDENHGMGEGRFWNAVCIQNHHIQSGYIWILEYCPK